MIRRFVVLATLLAAVVSVASVPATMLGAGPGHGQPPPLAVPPLRVGGPVVLPDGRVLPVRPAWAQESSVQAEMLAAHAGERIAFPAGERPRPREAARATTGLGGSAQQVATLGLAAAPLQAATLAASGSLPNGMRKEVLGFLPYWLLDAGSLQWMQYQLVTTIAYFGVAARSDGTLATSSGGSPTSGWGGWNSSAMTGVINSAHAHGVRVVLTITMMAWDGGAGQAALLASATARASLADAIVTAVRDRAADGVNLDFEPVATPQRDQYTSFVSQLKAALVAASVGSYLTVDTTGGAATWASGYDVAGLTGIGAADALFVMGYDYSWSGSARAGAVAPMDSPYILDVGESVDDYLALAPPGKIIWGVPYYGRTWQTTTGDPNSATRAGTSGASKSYAYTAARSLGAAYGRRWDDVGKVPWFAHFDSSAATWVEGYYDDATSLAAKYDMVNRKGLAGTGMWTLLMDQGESALWGLLAKEFVNDTSPPTGGIRTLPATSDEAAICVEWAATDVGSGVAAYSVQVRDRAAPAWEAWLTSTSATSGYFVGQPGHTYLFRSAAIDFKGNLQPWLPAGSPAGPALTVGGFAGVAAATLNVRSGAGTAFSVLDQLTAGSIVALLAGPIAAGGYDWYQAQFGFSEWPSADYPRLGWVAARSGATAYLVPAKPPNETVLAPTLTGYAPTGRWISPNGDGVGDVAHLAVTLPQPATGARLEVLSTSGTVVDTADLGALPAGTLSATWDGGLSGGGAASPGSYLLRVVATDAEGPHVAPASGVDAGLVARWGVTVDLARPSVTGRSATRSGSTGAVVVTAAFNEGVSGVSGSNFHLVDVASGVGVPASVAYDPANRRATLTPAADLVAGRTYRGILDQTIRDWAGNPLAPVSWTFLAPPNPGTFTAPRTLTFLSGAHTGYQFDPSGHVTASKAATLPATSTAPTSERNASLPGQSGAWFRVTAGIWAGYWVRESPTVYLPGLVAVTSFSPARTVTFAPGTYVGYRFDNAGSVTASKPGSLPHASGASAGSSAIINGRPYLAIVNGIWAGYWVAESSSVVVH